MATNQTTNYQLNQWEPTDQVLRTDFNADNAKLDDALTDLAISSRGILHLAYMVYDLALKDYNTSNTHGFRNGLLMDNFKNEDNIADLTGGMAVQNGALILNGAGKTGTMTTFLKNPGGSGWKRAIGWIRYEEGGTHTLSVNGTPLAVVDGWTTRTSEGTVCEELQVEAEMAGTASVTISLTISTGTAAQSKVYEYGVMFF